MAVQDCDCDCSTRCQAILEVRFPRAIPDHRVPLAALPRPIPDVGEVDFPLAEALDFPSAETLDFPLAETLDYPLAEVVRWHLMQLPT